MTTIQDIANKMGISKSTVSKALNDAPDISENLRKQILETAVALDYTKLRRYKNTVKKICVLVEKENIEYEEPNHFAYDIIMGFRQSAEPAGFEVEIVPVDSVLQINTHYDVFMLEHGYAGSFALGFSLNAPWLKDFKKTSTPTVLFDNYVPRTPNTCYIGTDNSEIMELIVSHLSHLGHRKIAFLNGSRHSLVTEQRMKSFHNSMEKRNLTVDPELAIYAYFVARVAEDHIDNILERGATAIICGNDVIASGVYTELMSRGLSIPEDISVVGIDDIPLASLLSPSLTTIRQERSFLGRSGFFALNSIITHNMAISRNLLRPELILRDSTSFAKSARGLIAL